MEVDIYSIKLFDAAGKIPIFFSKNLDKTNLFKISHQIMQLTGFKVQ